MSDQSNMTPPLNHPPDQPSKASKARRMDQAILALLQYPTIEKAAHAVGVHPTTLRRWLKQPKFQEKYSAARDEIYVHAKGRMLQGSQAAVGTVLRIMMDSSVAPGTRLQAAKYVMDSRERSERAERPSQHGSPGIEGTISVAECLLAARRRRRALSRKQDACEKPHASQPHSHGTDPEIPG